MHRRRAHRGGGGLWIPGPGQNRDQPGARGYRPGLGRGHSPEAAQAQKACQQARHLRLGVAGLPGQRQEGWRGLNSQVPPRPYSGKAGLLPSLPTGGIQVALWPGEEHRACCRGNKSGQHAFIGRVHGSGNPDQGGAAGQSGGGSASQLD